MAKNFITKSLSVSNAFNTENPCLITLIIQNDKPNATFCLTISYQAYDSMVRIVSKLTDDSEEIIDFGNAIKSLFKKENLIDNRMEQSMSFHVNLKPDSIPREYGKVSIDIKFDKQEYYNKLYQNFVEYNKPKAQFR